MKHRDASHSQPKLNETYTFAESTIFCSNDYNITAVQKVLRNSRTAFTLAYQNNTNNIHLNLFSILWNSLLKLDVTFNLFSIRRLIIRRLFSRERFVQFVQLGSQINGACNTNL